MQIDFLKESFYIYDYYLDKDNYRTAVTINALIRYSSRSVRFACATGPAETGHALRRRISKGDWRRGRRKRDNESIGINYTLRVWLPRPPTVTCFA